MQLFKTEMIFMPLQHAPLYRARRRRYGCRSVTTAVQPLAETLPAASAPVMRLNEHWAIENAA
jgi:hypothetical protein